MPETASIHQPPDWLLHHDNIGLLQQLAQCVALGLSASSVGVQWLAWHNAAAPAVVNHVLHGGDQQAWVQTWLALPDVKNLLASHGFAVEALPGSPAHLGLLRVAVVLPLVDSNQGQSILWVTRPATASLMDALLPQLFAFAKSMASIIDVLQQHQQLSQNHVNLQVAHGWLADSVARDMLTQMPNRRALMEFLDRSVSLAKREGQALSVVLFDVVGLTHVNKQHGDAIGDLVLKTVADRMLGCVRGSEMVGRVSGDEFMAVMYPCLEAQAALAAHRYAQALESAPVDGGMGGQPVPIRVAYGLHTVSGAESVHSHEVYASAVKHLDWVKRHSFASVL
jgi:diguanylate cyclase (GGDEF)-like protein